MPNPLRYTYQFCNSFIPDLTAIYGTVAIGASGAPTLSAIHSMGINSIARTGVGTYLVTFNKKYNRLIFAGASFVASGGAAAPNFTVDTNSISSAGTMVILTQNGGVNTDPASGESMMLKFEFKDSSVAAG